MELKRALNLGSLGVTLILATLAAPPAEVTAGCTICVPAGETSTHEGSGLSCAEADQEAIDAAMAEVPSSACDAQPVEVTECYPIYVDRPIYFAEWKVRYSFAENGCL